MKIYFAGHPGGRSLKRERASWYFQENKKAL